MQEEFLLFEQVEFLLIAGIVIVLAYLALEHDDIVYAAFFFGMMASAVAGFFLLLEAPFIAGMQIAVYTGGISALIIFGVLLLPRAQDQTLEIFAPTRKKRIGMLLSLLVVVLSAAFALLFPWSGEFPDERPTLSQSLEGLADWLWGSHGIYVQIVAIIMLTAIIGSIAILKMEKAERLQPIIAEFGVEVEDLEDEDEEDQEDTVDNEEVTEQ